MPQVCNSIKKETLAQVFFCEFCEISENIFFHRTLPVAASYEQCFQDWNVAPLILTDKTFSITLNFTQMQNVMILYCTIFINFIELFYSHEKITFLMYLILQAASNHNFCGLTETSQFATNSFTSKIFLKNINLITQLFTSSDDLENWRIIKTKKQFELNDQFHYR